MSAGEYWSFIAGVFLGAAVALAWASRKMKEFSQMFLQMSLNYKGLAADIEKWKAGIVQSKADAKSDER